MTYEEFVESKRRSIAKRGFAWDESRSYLFPFQQHTAKWALSKGRACVFAGTGLGKTRVQLVCADEVAKRHGRFLILAPLAVAGQTCDEASNIGIRTTRDMDDQEGIIVANYDQLHNIKGSFAGVALDESSILKSHDGAYRKELTERFADTPYRFAFTATPAPNDYMELGTHAEFMGVCTRTEMLAEWFTHDGGDTSKWRLKRHGRRDFWEWVSKWAMCYSNPSDIGYDGSMYALTELVIHDHIVGEASQWGGMFGGEDGGVSATNIRSVQRDCLIDRIEKSVDIEQSSDAPIILWCSTNEEHAMLVKRMPHAVGVQGSDSQEHKEKALLGFARGEFKTLVTKPSIAGFGMNWQHCSRMAFVSISYSYEMLYQAIRRCWRFGQLQPVHVHMIYSDAEVAVKAALEVKKNAHASMIDEMRRYVRRQAA